MAKGEDSHIDTPFVRSFSGPLYQKHLWWVYATLLAPLVGPKVLRIAIGPLICILWWFAEWISCLPRIFGWAFFFPCLIFFPGEVSLILKPVPFPTVVVAFKVGDLCSWSGHAVSLESLMWADFQLKEGNRDNVRCKMYMFFLLFEIFQLIISPRKRRFLGFDFSLVDQGLFPCSTSLAGAFHMHYWWPAHRLSSPTISLIQEPFFGNKMGKWRFFPSNLLKEKWSKMHEMDGYPHISNRELSRKLRE